MKSSVESLGLTWLWAAHLLMFRIMFLLLENLCGVSCTGTLGCWVKLGLSVGMETLGEFLSINIHWSLEFSDVLNFWS